MLDGDTTKGLMDQCLIGCIYLSRVEWAINHSLTDQSTRKQRGTRYSKSSTLLGPWRRLRSLEHGDDLRLVPSSNIVFAHQ